MTCAEIMRGRADDLPTIMPVMASAFAIDFGEAWTEAQCLGVVSMPGSHLYIATSGLAQGNAPPACAPRGFALSRVILNECELMLLAVTPEAQRRGIGQLLLTTLIDDARAANVDRIFLEVRSGNPAIKLYSSFGFAEVGRRRGYYRSPKGETFDALTYRLALS